MKHSTVYYGEQGRIYLVVCPVCNRDNHESHIRDGRCVWCGYKAVDEDIPKGGNK